MILVASLAPPEVHPVSGGLVALLAAGMALASLRGATGWRPPSPAALLAAAALLGLQLMVAVRPGGVVQLAAHAATVAFLVLYLRREDEPVRRAALLALGAAATLLSLDAIHQRLFRLGSPALEGLPSWLDPEAVRVRLEAGRVFSSHLLPASFGGFLVLGLAATLALAASSAGRRRVSLLAGALLQGVALALTFSVGALASAGLAALLAGATFGRHRRLVRVAALCLVLVAVVGTAVVRQVSPLDLEHPDNPLRLRAGNARAAALLFLDRPVAGWGGGGFATEYPRLRRAGDNETLHAHDAYLEVLAEGGLAAGLLMIAGLGALLALWRRCAKEEGGGLAVPLLLAGLLAFLLQNLFDFTAFLPGVALPFGAVLAALPWRVPPRREGLAVSLAAAALVTAALALAWVGVAQAWRGVEWERARREVARAAETRDAARADALRLTARDGLERVGALVPWDGDSPSRASELESDRIASGRGDPERARDLAQRGLARDPHGFRRHLALARAHGAEGRQGAAYARAAEARRRNPGSQVVAEVEEALRPPGSLRGVPAPSMTEGPPAGPSPMERGLLLLAPLTLVVALLPLPGGRGTASALLLLGLLLSLPWGQGGALPEALLLRQCFALALLIAALRPDPGQRSVRLRPGALALALLPAAAWALLAAAAADHAAAARSGGAAVVGAIILLALASSASRRDPSLLAKATAAVAASGGLVALVALAMSGMRWAGSAGRGERFSIELLRPRADFLNPGHMAAYLLLASAAAAGLAATRSGKRRLALLLASGALVLVALATGSRGPLLGLLAAGVVALAAASSLRLLGARARRATSLGLLALLVIGTVLVGLRFSQGDPYRWSRLSIWKASVGAVAERPLLGFGPGVFRQEARRYQVPAEGPLRYEKRFAGPHSDLLGAALASGVPGALLLLGGLGVGAAAALRASRRAESRGERWLAVALLAGCAALAAHGLVDDLSERPALWASAGILLALLAARDPRPSRALRLPAFPTGRAVLLAASGLLALLLFEVQPLLAYELRRICPGGAEAALTLAERVHPVSEGIPLERAGLLLAAPGPLSAGAFGRAESLARDSLRRAPASPRGHETLARVYHRAALDGLFSPADALGEALRATTEAASRDPLSCTLRAERGRLLAALGRFEEALAAAEEALALEPNFLRARLDRSVYLLELGRREVAAEELAEARRRMASLSGIRVPSPYAYELLVWEPERAARLEARLRESS